jgi:hypothetical protein
MKVFNKEMHDNLLALGYEHTRYVSKKYRTRFDMYDHPDNDDWFEIDEKGHIDPADLCGFTEGSTRGHQIYEDWKAAGKQGFLNFKNKPLPTELVIHRIGCDIKDRLVKKNMPFELELTEEKFQLKRLTEH